MVLVCLVGFFAVVAGVNAVMINAAVSTFGGVETENAYQAGLAFAREIAAARGAGRVALARGSEGVAARGGNARRGDRRTMTAGRPLTGLQASGRSRIRPTNAATMSSRFGDLAPARISGVTAAAAGQWNLVIELSRDGSAPVPLQESHRSALR